MHSTSKNYSQLQPKERVTLASLKQKNYSVRAMSWYYYLKKTLEMPFTAQCQSKRAISPLKVGQTVQVIGMAQEDECMSEIFVRIAWEESELAVPLDWLARGYGY